LKNTLKSSLKGKIPDQYLPYVPSSFDIVGSKSGAIAIVEVHCELEGFEKIIADSLMNLHKNVKSVLGKKSERHGEFRLRDYRLLSGDPNTEVVHKESGCIFKLDPRVTYFSTRESTERERICKQVSGYEKILVMFSGVGPFPICIAKHNRETECLAIEMNYRAHRYCLENIDLNKLENRVRAIHGDVKKICPQLDQQFDRVLMPLPKGAHLFLDVTIPLVKPGGLLHFYHWSSGDDLFGEAYNTVKQAITWFDRDCEFVSGVRVSKYSPGVSKVRIDVLVK
jgi:tRNA (guanine37-N1)-methyltransferase